MKKCVKISKKPLTMEFHVLPSAAVLCIFINGLATGTEQSMKWQVQSRGRASLQIGYPAWAIITLTALENNVLCEQGAMVKGHEFHYWDSTNTGKSFQARKPLRMTNWECIIARGNLWAGYPHIHFYSNIDVAIKFIKKAEELKNNE